jgi:hypothetical protein
MPITLQLQAYPVAECMPDADTDVLIFDGPASEGQLGAYVGHDEIRSYADDGAEYPPLKPWASFGNLRRKLRSRHTNRMAPNRSRLHAKPVKNSTLARLLFVRPPWNQLSQMSRMPSSRTGGR